MVDRNCEETNGEATANLAPTQFHPSAFSRCHYAYPAVSRRSKGVSIGVNLSPTKLCNFRCVYCQVERDDPKNCDVEPASLHSANAANPLLVDLEILERETLELARRTLDGRLFELPRFEKTRPDMRVLRDLAFSGDGEPTLAPQFPQAVEVLARARRELDYEPLKLVLITNATRLQAPEIRDALDVFRAANGEIWAKLDAATPEQLRRVNQTRVSFDAILANILFAAQRWGVKIQTALFNWRGENPRDEFVKLYCERVRAILEQGGRVDQIQLYTVARPPAFSQAKPLNDEELDRFAAIVRDATGLDVDVFYSK